MTFLQKLLGKKPVSDPAAQADSPPEAATKQSDLADADLTVNIEVVEGTQLGERVAALLEQAAVEGWHPLASIRIVCSRCQYPVGLEFDDPVGGGTIGYDRGDSFVGLENAITCEKCGSTGFRILYGHRTMKEWLYELLQKIPPTQDDLELGFRSLRTNQLIGDHQFVVAHTLEDLWSAISDYLDPQGSLKSDFSFNYLTTTGGSQVYIRKTVGIAHQNKLTGGLLVIVKDVKGRFWYRIAANL